MSGYYYLASPYTKFPRGPEAAFEEVCKVAAKLMDLEIPIFCPIAHTHPIAQFTTHDPLDSAFWLGTNHELMMAARAGLIVIQMEGWEQSSGITAEIKFFESTGRPIYYLFPSDLGIESFIKWDTENKQ